jgi:hypothetical protein
MTTGCGMVTFSLYNASFRETGSVHYRVFIKISAILVFGNQEDAGKLHLWYSRGLSWLTHDSNKV